MSSNEQLVTGGHNSEVPRTQLPEEIFDDIGLLAIPWDAFATGGTASLLTINTASGELAAKVCSYHDGGIDQSGMNLIAAFLKDHGIEVEHRIGLAEPELNESERAWYLDAATVRGYLQRQKDIEGEVVSPMQMYEELYRHWREHNSANLDGGLLHGNRVFQLFIREFFMNLELEWRFDSAYGGRKTVDQQAHTPDYPAPFVRGLCFTATVMGGRLLYKPVIVMDKFAGLSMWRAGLKGDDEFSKGVVEYFNKLLGTVGIEHGDLKTTNIIFIDPYDPNFDYSRLSADEYQKYFKVIDFGSAALRSDK